jgi:hypothetical protein
VDASACSVSRNPIQNGESILWEIAGTGALFPFGEWAFDVFTGHEWFLGCDFFSLVSFYALGCVFVTQASASQANLDAMGRFSRSAWRRVGFVPTVY